MAASDAMTIDERRKYLAKVIPRYMEAGKQERSRLLTEMEAVTGMHRKSLLRLLHAESLERPRRAVGRSRQYSVATEEVIRVVWESVQAPRSTGVPDPERGAGGALRLHRDLLQRHPSLTGYQSPAASERRAAGDAA